MPQALALVDHTGGLKTNVSPFFAGKNYSPNALNVEYAQSLGSVSKATQYAQYGSDAGGTKIQGIFPFQAADNTKRLFMASNGIIYEDVAGTWTSRKTGLSDSTDYGSAMFYNRLYVANGSDGLQYTDDGTTWNNVSAAVGSHIAVFKNRLYLANIGSGSNRNRFEYSDLGDGTTVANNTVDEIESAINGIHATYNVLYLFTEKSFWSWDETYLQKVDNVGTTAGRSVASGNGRLFFANRDGVWMSTGGKAQLISRPVQYWIDGVSASNYSEYNAAFWKNEYYLWIGDTQDQANVVLVFNTLYNTWRILTNWPSEEMAVWTNTSGEENLYFGNNAADSLVFKAQEVYSQAGVSTASVYDYDVQFPATPDKEFQGISIHCFAESDGNPVFQLSYALDSEDTFHELYSWVLQGNGYMEQVKIDLPSSCKGKAVQFRVSETGSANAWHWHGIKMYFDAERGVND